MSQVQSEQGGRGQERVGEGGRRQKGEREGRVNFLLASVVSRAGANNRKRARSAQRRVWQKTDGQCP